MHKCMVSVVIETALLVTFLNVYLLFFAAFSCVISTGNLDEKLKKKMKWNHKFFGNMLQDSSIRSNIKLFILHLKYQVNVMFSIVQLDVKEIYSFNNSNTLLM